MAKPADVEKLTEKPDEKAARPSQKPVKKAEAPKEEKKKVNVDSDDFPGTLTIDGTPVAMPELDDFPEDDE